MAQSLENLGTSLRPQVTAYLDESRFGELDAWAKNLGKRINTRITVIDEEGIVLADSDEDPAVMVNHKFRPEIAEAYRGAVGRSLRFSNTVKADMLYIGIPLELGGGVTNVLRLSLYVEDINNLLSDLSHIMWRSILGITLLALFGTFLFARHISRPVKEMSRASQSVAAGDFRTRIFVKNRDELGELARSFNLMTERIEALFTELSRQKDELDSIISSIDECIVVVDKDGRVLFSNKSFRDLVNNQEANDKYYWEVVRKEPFVALIKRTQKELKDQAQEIVFNGKTYLCNTFYLEAREEVVVTFYDLTKIRNVEQIKKDFVDNISHELRTPLAAIKGFVETMEDGMEGENRNYLEIIKRNTERLINIVQDLLTLSELEEKEIVLEKEDVDVKVLIENILTIFKDAVEKKGIALELKADSELPKIKGDAFKLEQMFINLIDNAIKYTEAGKISLVLKKEEESLVVEIQDTGIGIPEDQQSRIFERFYVVDKSRSKTVGGTGLGLSIVKHIAQLHDAKLTVKSSPGDGTMFSICFPT
ncbi:MAG: ATP-binding protein [Candidatus Aminicenantes bacterium]|jgi:two-component system phosphate regulon sensor histidine kinase PhoR